MKGKGRETDEEEGGDTDYRRGEEADEVRREERRMKGEGKRGR